MAAFGVYSHTCGRSAIPEGWLMPIFLVVDVAEGVMRKKAVLLTGAAGEIGQALIRELAARDEHQLITMDLRPLPEELQGLSVHMVGDILDENMLSRLTTEYAIDAIFHLAALLSTRAEFTPELAHRVNVDGTLNLLRLAAEQSQWQGEPVRFIFPSSIAAYGLPSLTVKERDACVREWEWNSPATMYGCNKLYCELLGGYYSRNYKQLASGRPTMLDFRSLRFPGLVSAFTVPSGGTSDYGPEMIHAAAQGEAYACFVRPDTRIPLMAMPDAIDALLRLAAAPRAALTRTAYNSMAFNPTALEIKDAVVKAFPDAALSWALDVKRQRILDSWPATVDDTPARRDWGFEPVFDFEGAFERYLIPRIRDRYRAGREAPPRD